MALRDTWHRALVYFGLAEDHDYGPEYDEIDDPDTGSEDLFEGPREREPAQVRRPPTSPPGPPPAALAPRAPRRDRRHLRRRRADLRDPDPHAATGGQR